MLLFEDNVVQSAYQQSAYAGNVAQQQAGKIASISALEEKLTPLVKNVALAGIAFIGIMMLLSLNRRGSRL